MRRIVLLAGLITAVAAPSAKAGPGSASGPITVDSSTFVPGTSVMGTDGGFYSSSPKPVGSGTTAAFGMTQYRAQHVNLRDALGGEIGTVGNPLFTTASSTITLTNITVTNSSFSVTGSSITAAQPNAAALNATVVQAAPSSLRASVSIMGSSNTVQAQQSGAWAVNSTAVNVATVTFNGTPNVAVSNNPVLGASASNIGTVSGSSITIPGTVNAKQVNVSTVIVSQMPSVTVSLSTVTITNTAFGVTGVSSVTVMNTNIPVQVTTPLPFGGNNIGTVTGSSVTVNGTVGATILNTPNVSVTSFPPITQSVPANLKASVYISGSSNTVVANQGGAPWSENVTQIAGHAVAGSSLPVTGTLTVTASSGTAAAAAYQAGTWTTQAQQSGSWTETATQGTPANLQASVSINGSSNTVSAAQSGAWTAAVTQGTAANLKASVLIDGTSNQVQIAGTPNVYVVNPTTSPLQVQNGSGSNTSVGWQVNGASVPVHETGTATVSVSNTPSVLAAQTGSRWAVAFSTPTTAVMTSTGTSSSVTISTPVAAASSQTVRVFRLLLTVDAATNIQFRDGSTAFGETYYLPANGAIVLDLTNEPWYVTSSGNGFSIKQTGSANVGVRIWYQQS